MKLYKSENLDNPIQTVSLGQSLFFHFPPLLRDGEVRPPALVPRLCCRVAGSRGLLAAAVWRFLNQLLFSLQK